jgi:DNA processing protein
MRTLSLRDAVALSLLRGQSPQRAGRVLKEATSEAPDHLLEACVAWLASSDDGAERQLAQARLEADRTLAPRPGQTHTAVAWGDPRYPERLAAIDDPPPALWLRGTAPLDAPAVAIVGSRAAAVDSLHVARSLARDLALRGMTVVSGLARGVDSAAHRGALDGGGVTIAVLGSGVDVIYPPEHDALAEEITRNGLLLSELVPGTPPRPGHFPMRNRIIAGLSLGVVVVEASERSGSLITADLALAQGREVMAVPGGVCSGRHRGAHALLKAGAAVIESADDVIDALGLGGRSAGSFRAPAPCVADAWLDQMAAGDPHDIDALASLSGLDIGALLPRLLELELQGAISRVEGGRFVRLGGTC